MTNQINQIPRGGYHSGTNISNNAQAHIRPAVGLALPSDSDSLQALLGSHRVPTVLLPQSGRGGLTQQVQQLTQLVQKLIGILTGRPSLPIPQRPTFPDINSLPGGGVNSPWGVGKPGDIQTLPGRDIVPLDKTGPVTESTPQEVTKEKTPWYEKVLDYIGKGKKIFDSGKDTWNTIKKYGADIWNGVKDAGRWVAGLFV